MIERERTAPVSELTTVMHRYRLRDGTVVRHRHKYGVQTRRERRLRLVRELMRSIDITQVQIAKDSGLSPEHLNRVLHGKGVPSTSVADALARASGYRDSAWWGSLLGVKGRRL